MPLRSISFDYIVQLYSEKSGTSALMLTWLQDTNQHSIADVHPGDLEAIVFPGQDFNNARIMDFEDVAHWQNNKLDRKYSSRMGWSDISINVQGSVVEDLKQHFVQRWNFIYDAKYDVRKDSRYHRLNPDEFHGQTHEQWPHGYGMPSQSQADPAQEYPSQMQQASIVQGHERFSQGSGPAYGSAHGSLRTHPSASSYVQRVGQEIFQEGEEMKEHLERRAYEVGNRFAPSRPSGHPSVGSMSCQLVRSACKWSNGTQTEHSIANAYANLIRQANHFVYIENQFFITATGNKQSPIKNNLIGSAIVERILRAARSGQKFKVIVMMPAIPAFAGDLKSDSSLGTRAIMENQYNTINRGGHSIMEEIAQAGFDPLQYIRWYNLRNYDRINTSSVMQEAERRSGVNYEDARRAHDYQVDPLGYQRGTEAGFYQAPSQDQSSKYQQAAKQVPDRLGLKKWDSVADCYMLHGPDIREIPWEGDQPEMDAFVQEELYIHSKVMIVDDRTVVCGSANCNDRSMLGTHDSEIGGPIHVPLLW